MFSSWDEEMVLAVMFCLKNICFVRLLSSVFIHQFEALFYDLYMIHLIAPRFESDENDCCSV